MSGTQRVPPLLPRVPPVLVARRPAVARAVACGLPPAIGAVLRVARRFLSGVAGPPSPGGAGFVAPLAGRARGGARGSSPRHVPARAGGYRRPPPLHPSPTPPSLVKDVP
jgi:hypothetical protein